DTLLGGQGYYRGSSILVTGTAGTGKTTIAAHFAQATCKRGERCLYVASEESPQQVLRNMKSIGVDLAPFRKDDRLRFYAVRPTAYGLEMHLVKLYDWIKEFQPSTVIIDPMSNLILSGTLTQTKLFFIRLIDLLKSLQITVLLTNLTAGQYALEQTEVGVSSLMDTWLEIRTLETNGERNRVLYILKSRGMNHSNQVREFRLTPSGAELLDVYVGQGTVLTGTARVVQAAQEQQERLSYQQTLERKQREFERKQTVVQAQILAMQAQLEAEQEELTILVQQDQAHQKTLLQDRSLLAQLRRAD
ncbi:MAG TPA: ATPase domain-containing protein, partial [Allocoleopsis sp.]